MCIRSRLILYPLSALCLCTARAVASCSASCVATHNKLTGDTHATVYLRYEMLDLLPQNYTLLKHNNFAGLCWNLKKGVFSSTLQQLRGFSCLQLSKIVCLLLSSSLLSHTSLTPKTRCKPQVFSPCNFPCLPKAESTSRWRSLVHMCCFFYSLCYEIDSWFCTGFPKTAPLEGDMLLNKMGKFLF